MYSTGGKMNATAPACYPQRSALWFYTSPTGDQMTPGSPFSLFPVWSLTGGQSGKLAGADMLGSLCDSVTRLQSLTTHHWLGTGCNSPSQSVAHSSKCRLGIDSQLLPLACHALHNPANAGHRNCNTKGSGCGGSAKGKRCKPRDRRRDGSSDKCVPE